jgi:osmoprotectant transport system permease protein
VATGGDAAMMGSIVSWLFSSSHWQGSQGIPTRLGEHLYYSALAVGIALVIALPIGLLIGHTGKGTTIVVGLANSLRALPTIGLLIFFVVLISPHIGGGGDAAYLIPSEIVLVLLAIPAILSNTYAGVQNVDPAARDAAAGMGMTGSQVLFRVELPCALPLILSGVRSATLQVVATATIAAYVSLGGLGRFVFDGQAQQDYPQMASGAVLVALLALAAELVLMLLERAIVSPGISRRYARGAAGRAEPEPEGVLDSEGLDASQSPERATSAT